MYCMSESAQCNSMFDTGICLLNMTASMASTLSDECAIIMCMCVESPQLWKQRALWEYQ